MIIILFITGLFFKIFIAMAKSGATPIETDINLTEEILAPYKKDIIIKLNAGKALKEVSKEYQKLKKLHAIRVQRAIIKQLIDHCKESEKSIADYRNSFSSKSNTTIQLNPFSLLKSLDKNTNVYFTCKSKYHVDAPNLNNGRLSFIIIHEDFIFFISFSIKKESNIGGTVVDFGTKTLSKMGVPFAEIGNILYAVITKDLDKKDKDNEQIKYLGQIQISDIPVKIDVENSVAIPLSEITNLRVESVNNVKKAVKVIGIKDNQEWSIYISNDNISIINDVHSDINIALIAKGYQLNVFNNEIVN